jgi:hypothetical protein
MTIAPRIGFLLISFSIDEDRIHKAGMKFDILLPPQLQRKARQAFCHVHRVSVDWNEVNLTNQHILVDRWAATPFKVNHEGSVHEFHSISQWGVLAIVNEQE